MAQLPRYSTCSINNKRRQGINLKQQELVKIRPLFNDERFNEERLNDEKLNDDKLNDEKPPCLIEPVVPGVQLLNWCQQHQHDLQQSLLKTGAVLLRGFQLESLQEFQQLMSLLGGDIMQYQYRSTPRTKAVGGVYTSTEYPASQTIALHNEMSYARQWPAHIAFYCRETADLGGETPICDSRRVWHAIDPAIKKTFADRGVLYVRNYARQCNMGLDLGWQDVFQVQSPHELEQVCEKLQIQWQWQGDHLHTRQVCQSSVNHPITGETVWFNQAHLFHVSSLAPELQKVLLESQGVKNLSRHAYYGDGSDIEDDVLQHIRDVYQQETVTFNWQEGDVLLLDNVLAAHGRKPFQGNRQVYVAMTQ